LCQSAVSRSARRINYLNVGTKMRWVASRYGHFIPDGAEDLVGPGTFTETATRKKLQRPCLKWTSVLQVSFQVLTATSIKMAVFWDVAPCSLVEVCRCFRDIYCLQTAIRALMMDSKNHWNISQYVPDYIAQHPRKQTSSFRRSGQIPGSHNDKYSLYSEWCTEHCIPVCFYTIRFVHRLMRRMYEWWIWRK
jgi:hypothetical protein